MSKHQVLCQLKKKTSIKKNKKTRHFCQVFYICHHIKYMLTTVDNKKKYTIPICMVVNEFSGFGSSESLILNFINGGTSII